MIASVQGPNVTACVAFARRLFDVPLGGHREATRSGGEDGLYRVTLECGRVVECTMTQRRPCEGNLIPE